VWSELEKNKKMANIYMIGAGNLATNLSLALKNKGYKIVSVYSKTIKSAKILAEKLNCKYTNKIDSVTKYDLAFISINDDAINKISKKIIGPAVHTSGFKNIDVLDNNIKGVFYPIQTFDININNDFKNIPICIESNNKEFEKQIMTIAKDISKNVLLLNSDERKYLHLSAVISCNFSNLLYQFAEEICNKKNISFDLLKPLILQTAKKIDFITPKDAQTGPAKRRDHITIKHHLELLKEDDEKLEIYDLITKSILKRL